MYESAWLQCLCSFHCCYLFSYVVSFPSLNVPKQRRYWGKDSYTGKETGPDATGVSFKVVFLGTSRLVQWLRLCAPNAGDMGMISAQGTGSHMLQVGVCMPQLKIAGAATKDIHTDFPVGPMVRNPLANAGDTGSIPGPGRFHMPWGN